MSIHGVAQIREHSSDFSDICFLPKCELHESRDLFFLSHCYILGTQEQCLADGRCSNNIYWMDNQFISIYWFSYLIICLICQLGAFRGSESCLITIFFEVIT